jgi:hypothetical protein
MNRLYTVVLLLIISAALPSCSFYRLVTGKKKGEVKKIVLAGADTSSVAKVPVARVYGDSTVIPHDSAWVAKHALNSLIAEVTPLWSKRLDFKTYSAKAKMHFESPDAKHEFTAHIRVRKDSVIWINITAAMGGLQVARIFVTRDSFFMLLYMDKEAMAVPLSRVVRILPGNVDYASFQNLIMGEPLREGAITDAQSYPNSITLTVEDTSYVQQITYNRSDSVMRESVLRTHNPVGPEAITSYTNYEIANGRRISTLRSLNIRNGNDVYRLDMNINKSVFDEPQDFPFSIPSNYTMKQ